MAERMAASRDRIGSMMLDEDGQPCMNKEWYQTPFYQDMTMFYMSPNRVRMQTKPQAKLRSTSKLGSFGLTSLNDYGPDSPSPKKTSSPASKKKKSMVNMPKGTLEVYQKKSNALAATTFDLPPV